MLVTKTKCAHVWLRLFILKNCNFLKSVQIDKKFENGKLKSYLTVIFETQREHVLQKFQTTPPKMFEADFQKCILFVFYFLFYSHRIQNRIHRMHKIKFGLKHIQHEVCHTRDGRDGTVTRP